MCYLPDFPNFNCGENCIPTQGTLGFSLSHSLHNYLVSSLPPSLFYMISTTKISDDDHRAGNQHYFIHIDFPLSLHNISLVSNISNEKEDLPKRIENSEECLQLTWV